MERKKRSSYTGLSERTKRRKFAKDLKVVKEQLINVESSSNSYSIENSHTYSVISNCHTNKHSQSTHRLEIESSSSSSSFISENESSDSPSSYHKNKSLLEQLGEWSKFNNITLQATSQLLHILHPYHPSLPLDARTLLQTPHLNTVVACAGGSIVYFGVKDNLIKQASLGLTESKYPIVHKLSNKLNCPEKLLTITVNIDGCPLEKSTTKCFWPVLCTLDQALNRSRPFVVAVFYGSCKPSSSNEFLKRFIDECLELEQDGIYVNNVKFRFRISCIIADAPARSFLKNIVSHNSLYGCEKCEHEGTYLGRTTWQYQDRKPNARTDESFDKCMYDDHQKSKSALSFLSIGLISQIPLDYMHLVCLGVVKRLIRVWLGKGPKQCRLNSYNVGIVSDRLLGIGANFYPIEFSRRPRSLSDFKFWKATEFRSFLLYLGPVVLINILSQSLYSHFLTLHCAIYILCSELSQETVWVQYAKDLLDCFVKNTANLYSKELLVYNVHNLLHIADDVLNYGSLDNFSAFPYENMLGQLKKMVRAHNRPLEQLCNRLLEKSNFVNKPLCERKETFFKDGTIKSICLEGGVILKCNNNTMADSCFLTKSKEIVIVKTINKVGSNLCYTHNCETFKEKYDFYHTPLASSLLDIYKVKSEKRNAIVISSSDIFKKCHLLPCFKDKTAYVCVPYCNMNLANK